MRMPHDPGEASLSSAPSYAGPWKQLRTPLHATLHDHVSSVLGFAQMTPVQSSVIPLFLSHKDVIVEAVTGSGKTLAYVLPVLQILARRQDRLGKTQVGALVVCPTRELAIQVHAVFNSFLSASAQNEEDGQYENGTEESASSTELPIRHVLLAVGGSTSTPAEDYRRFKQRGSDIIVGTPGRVEELLKHSMVDTKDLEVLVLDEADRLLDMGFQNTLTSILQMLPKQRRTGLFSATMTDALGELVRVGLRNPVRVAVKVTSRLSGKTVAEGIDKRTPALLENFYAVSRLQEKLALTLQILRNEVMRPDHEQAMRKAIVYFATCAQVNYFFKVLSPLAQLQGFKLYSLHGKQTPARRRAAFDAFVSATPMGKLSTDEMSSILLCTDVAARGLDLPNVDLVIQFDPPTDPKVFSHRCGRTARAGRRGRAVILLAEGREEQYVDFLKVRKSPVRPYPLQVEGEDVLSRASLQLHNAMREQALQDRAVHELGMQAFVSFIQCFRKHEVSFIFRERDVDFEALAFAFGLLTLPRMPEISQWRKRKGEAEQDEFDNFLAFKEIYFDAKAFAYADSTREKQRLAALQERQRNGTSGSAKAAVESKKRKSKKRKSRSAIADEAWSDQKAQKERRQMRREKKQKKREYLARENAMSAADVAAPFGENFTANNDHDARDDDDDDDDAEDWAAEEREAKRLRKLDRSKMAYGLTVDDDGGGGGGVAAEHGTDTNHDDMFSAFA